MSGAGTGDPDAGVSGGGPDGGGGAGVAGDPPSSIAAVLFDHTDPPDSIARLAELRGQAQDAVFRAANYTFDTMTALSARLLELLNAHSTIPNLVQAVLQVANTLSLQTGAEANGGKAMGDTGLLEGVAQVLLDSALNLSLSYDAALIVKNVCLTADIRSQFAPVFIPAVVKSCLLLAPADESRESDPVPELLLVIRMYDGSIVLTGQDPVPSHKVTILQAFSDALVSVCFSRKSAATALNFLLNYSISEDGRTALSLELVSNVLAVLEAHPPPAFSDAPVAVLVLANMFMSPKIRDGLTVPVFGNILDALKRVASCTLGSLEAQHGVLKAVHHLSLRDDLCRGLRERGAYEVAMAACGVFATHAELQQTACKLMAELGKDPHNKLDVPEAVIQHLVTAATSTADGYSGVSAMAGAAMTAFTQGCPPTTERFQAALLLAMGGDDDEDDDDEEEHKAGDGDGGGGGSSQLEAK